MAVYLTEFQQLELWLHQRCSEEILSSSKKRGDQCKRSLQKQLAERGRFELPIDLRLCRISSAVHSTTLPPLRKASHSSLVEAMLT